MTRAVVVLLAGCNAVLGLDPTVTDQTSDRDGDGIADDLDNCPDFASTDLTDTDGDGLGDPCDPCSWPSDPARDDDGDGAATAADNCPGVAGAQTDGDGDGVGDACDPQPGKHDKLRCFTDFSADPAGIAALFGVAGDWTVDLSRLAHDGIDAYLFATVGGLADLRAYAVEATVDLNLGISNFASGIGVGASPATAGIRCVIEHDALRIRNDAAVLAEQPMTWTQSEDAVRLVVHRRADGSDLECHVSDGNVTITASGPVIEDNASIVVSDRVAAAFTSIAVYELGP
jgi:thrombospondin type 3 repeat protein